jgi:hypothetical protein
VLTLRGGRKEATHIPTDVGAEWQGCCAPWAFKPPQLVSARVFEQGKTPLTVKLNPLEVIDRDWIAERNNVVEGLQASLPALFCHGDYL